MDNQQIWELYQNGVEHHNLNNIYGDAKRNSNFYKGYQWEGCKTGKEELPVLNFIKPICKYKISMVAQNLMSIVFNSISENSNANFACEALTKLAQKQWEKSKMDNLCWDIIKNSCISGESYLYSYVKNGGFSICNNDFPQIQVKCVEGSNVYFANEENPNIDQQDYIIISEKQDVAKIREIARKNKISSIDIEKITCDENFNENDTLPQQGEEKCISLLFMRKTNRGIEFCRCVKSVIYEPFKVVEGLKSYPIAVMKWEKQMDSARGLSGVKHMIANQLEVNKTVARRAVIVKRFAYPIMVYDNEKVPNPEGLSVAGTLVGVDNLESTPLNSLINYISPAPVSQDAQILQNELIMLTRELEGATDAAIGQIDPTKASGEAIRAARDQAVVPLNEQISNYKQFVEDVAIVWFNLWKAYFKSTIKIVGKENKEQYLNCKDLQKLEPNIKIDVSPVDPFSKLSREIVLEKLMMQNQISFDEYVNALGNDSSAPKNKLAEILEKRREEVYENKSDQNLLNITRGLNDNEVPKMQM